MEHVGRFIIVVGVVLAVIGTVVWVLGRMGFKGLPGDIRFESENTRVFIPIVTCIVLSIILTILVNLGILIYHWWHGR